MAKIRKSVFRSGIVMLSLLAAIVAGSSVAQAQKCVVRVEGGSNTVRAEGMTEVVGNLQLRCGVADAVFGFGGDIPTDIKLAVELSETITNEVTDDVVTHETVALDYATAGISLVAWELNTDGAVPGTDPESIHADMFGDGELSEDGTMIEWEFPSATAGFGISPATGIYGFDLTISGIRVDASAVVEDGGDITANVLVGEVAVNSTPLKVAEAANGLGVEVSAAEGLQCRDDVTQMATITIKEGFEAGIVAGDSFVVTFTGIPYGVTVMVPTAVALPVLGGEVTQDMVDAAISLTLENTEGVDATTGEVELTDSGAGEVVYTVAATAADLDEESVDLTVDFMWDLETPVVLGSGSVAVSFDPVNTDADDTDVPRFVASSDSDTVVTVGDCVTSLIFPFVTNLKESGYDTGIAITNTSGDAGTCTISYNGTGAPADQETAEIGGNGQVVFGLSGGNTELGGMIVGVPGFQGYLDVECGFRDGKGFAFISHGSPMSGPSAAHGYLVKDEKSD